jgi:hypothetical protein
VRRCVRLRTSHAVMAHAWTAWAADRGAASEFVGMASNRDMEGVKDSKSSLVSGWHAP